MFCVASALFGTNSLKVSPIVPVPCSANICCQCGSNDKTKIEEVNLTFE